MLLVEGGDAAACRGRGWRWGYVPTISVEEGSLGMGVDELFELIIAYDGCETAWADKDDENQEVEGGMENFSLMESFCLSLVRSLEALF